MNEQSSEEQPIQSQGTETLIGNPSKKTADRPHNWTIGLAAAAVLVSLTSAGISTYSARFAKLQYSNALDARDDVRKSAAKQSDDVSRAREAAESSAIAAGQLARLASSEQQLKFRSWLSDQNLRWDDVGEILVGLTNKGGTTATDVKGTCTERDISGSVAYDNNPFSGKREKIEHVILTPPISPGQQQDLYISLVKHAPNEGQVSCAIGYGDSLGIRHQVTFQYAYRRGSSVFDLIDHVNP